MDPGDAGTVAASRDALRAARGGGAEGFARCARDRPAGIGNDNTAVPAPPVLPDRSRPAVLTANATSQLRDGDRVTVDGTRGTVLLDPEP